MADTISVSIIITFAAELLFSLALPILALVIWKKKEGTELRPAWIGAAAYFVFGMVLEQLINAAVLGTGSSAVSAFLLVYALLFVLLLVLLALEGLDFITTFSAAASCFNNVGPGMELVGPMSNYTCFSSFGKVLLAFSMLFGRLELYPMLLLFIPAAWRK